MKEQKHIFSADTIPQYKIMEYILDLYNLTDTRDLVLTKKWNFLSRNEVEVIDENNNKVIYTYDEETKTISSREVV